MTTRSLNFQVLMVSVTKDKLFLKIYSVFSIKDNLFHSLLQRHFHYIFMLLLEKNS